MFTYVRAVFLAVFVPTVSCICIVIAGNAAVAAEPTRGGTLRVVLRIPTANLDPIFGNAPGTDKRYYNLYAENMLYMDEAGKFHPFLAERWDIAHDGKSIVFHLRRDVKFQDGTTFNADAVKFNLDRLLDPKVLAPAARWVTEIQSVDVVNEYTVRVNLKLKSGVVLSMLAVEPGSMMSPTAIKAKGADFSRSPVGTGPFQIVSWSGNEIKAERNPNYWRKAKDGKPLPYLDKVEITNVVSSPIRLMELQSGNAQLIDGLEPKDLEKINKNVKLAVMKGGVSVTQLLSFNLTRPPFNNADLRRAVAYAINREAIQKVVSLGMGGGVLTGFEPSTTWVYDKSLRGHRHDIAKAREYYAKSGYKGTLVLSAIQREPDIQVAQLLQSMLKSAGMDLKIEMSERLAWVSKASTRSYDLGLSTNSIARPDPDVTYTTYFSAEASKNYSGFDVKLVTDPMIVKARAELDLTARRKIYTELQQYVLDNFYYSPLFWYPVQDGASARLQGFQREASLTWFYSELWLKP